MDERARPVVALVNSHPSFFTTSSCAGRVSLFADPTSATRAAGMKGGEWVYVNHDPADADAVVAAVRRKLGDARDEDAAEDAAAPVPDPECTLVLRFEPFILSVEASSIDEGGRIVACARDAGYRESGITASDKRTVCSIRCSIRMEVPVVSRGVRLVTDDALRALVGIANEKWTANAARAERLVERFTAVFGSETKTTTTPTPTPRVETRTRGGNPDPPRAFPRPPRPRRTPPPGSPVGGLAGALRAAAEAEDWVYIVDKPSAKACKDAPSPPGGWTRRDARASPTGVASRSPSPREVPRRSSRRSRRARTRTRTRTRARTRARRVRFQPRRRRRWRRFARARRTWTDPPASTIPTRAPTRPSRSVPGRAARHVFLLNRPRAVPRGVHPRRRARDGSRGGVRQGWRDSDQVRSWGIWRCCPPGRLRRVGCGPTTRWRGCIPRWRRRWA